MLMAAPVLAHYDAKLPLRLAGNASNYGIGVVISHVYEDRSKRLVAYASKTIEEWMQLCSVRERSSISSIWCQEISQFPLWEGVYIIYTPQATDYHIRSEAREIPPLAGARLQRWAHILAAHPVPEVSPTDLLENKRNYFSRCNGNSSMIITHC